MPTAQNIILSALASFSSRIAIVDGDKTVTYKVLDEHSARLASALSALGCSSQQPVAVLLPNCREFIEVDVACCRSGITRLGISTRLSPEEVDFMLQHAQARVLITSSGLLNKLNPSSLAALKAVILVDDDRSRDNILGYSDIILKARASEFKRVAEADPSYILYTSGTTGRPKGATHSHGSRALAVVNMLASELRVTADCAYIHCAPLTHGSGSKLLPIFAVGGRHVLMPKFDPMVLARHIEAGQATHTFLVPTMLQMLLDSGERVRSSVKTMQQITFGGAPITNALFGRSVEGFGPILTQIYGSCEAPHPITVFQPEDYVYLPDPSEMGESAGRPTPLSEIGIVDDDGKFLGVGEEGELLVRAQHQMTHYWRDEAATATSINADGWYKTGDIAVVNARNFVSFRDRKRDLIISGGLNVYPSEVERVLADHPAVSEVAVIGYPDDEWGESIMACIVPTSQPGASEAELIEWVGERLAGYKKPRRIEFMSSLPKGTSNKVLKRELKARYWEGRGRRIN